jgi:AcrR family transcriptional regulator
MSDCFIRRLGRPSREDALRLSDQVLAAAARLFAERGYAATSIAAVASEARVGKHTIYRRFPDKAELFRAVVQEKGNELLGLDDTAEPAPGQALAMLRRQVERVARAIATPDCLWIYRLIVAEGERFPELRGIIMKYDEDPLADRCGYLIARCQQEGSLGPGDPTDLANILLDLVATSLLHRRLASDETIGDAQVDAALERGWRFFLRGAGGALGGGDAAAAKGDALQAASW